MYVFDTSAFIHIFNFFPKRFPTLWAAFEDLITNQELSSVREVLREIEEQDDKILKWAEDRKEIFLPPDPEEAVFIGDIFKVKHFQFSLEKQKLLKGGVFADPFVIARAKILNGTVVTQEKKKPNSAKIPNICEHFNVSCLNLEDFMEAENWEF